MLRVHLLVVAGLVLAGGGILGGAAGFGASLMTAPLLLVAGLPIGEVVVANLATTAATRVWTVTRLRQHVNWTRMLPVIAGSIPGAAAGVMVLPSIDVSLLRLVVGCVVAASGLTLGIVPHAKAVLRWPAGAVIGLAAGFLGTTTSVNGAPVAIALSRAERRPLTFVADMGAFFLLSDLFSLALIGARGTASGRAFLLSLPVLIGCGLVGNVCGLHIARRVPPAIFGICVRALIVAAGILTIATR